jgi:5-hydroxyisourate hydrolase
MAPEGVSMGRLSTHVLDNVLGRPASGVEIELFALEGKTRRLVDKTRTNADGRTDAP